MCGGQCSFEDCVVNVMQKNTRATLMCPRMSRSARSACRQLNREGYNGTVALHKPLICNPPCLRIQWCKNHRRWSTDMWKKKSYILQMTHPSPWFRQLGTWGVSTKRTERPEMEERSLLSCDATSCIPCVARSVPPCTESFQEKYSHTFDRLALGILLSCRLMCCQSRVEYVLPPELSAVLTRYLPDQIGFQPQTPSLVHKEATEWI